MSRLHERLTVESSELPKVAAGQVAHKLRELAQARPGPIAVALAGGSTPRAMHEALAREPGVPWERVVIYFGDERCVPPDSADSNYRMAHESLLTRVPIAPEHVHRMQADDADRMRAATAYDALLPPALDLLILGIGEDGHTLSLFPGSPAIDETKRRVLPVIGPKPPPQRLTLLPPVISTARHVMTLASGGGKAEAVKRALEGDWDPKTTPAQLAREGLWLLDAGAAGALASP
jgi:6-phosphogluconolactonase